MHTFILYSPFAINCIASRMGSLRAASRDRSILNQIVPASRARSNGDIFPLKGCEEY